MTWRSAAGIVVGAVVWLALFLALTMGLAWLWPDYAAHGSTWFAYLALQHLVLSWDVFPWWYNIGVIVPAFPAVLLGARIARGAQAVSTQSISTSG